MSGIDCEQVLRDIEAFLDGELPEGRAARLEAHVHECSECLDRREFRRAVVALVRRSCAAEEPSVELPARIRRALFRG